ncbi:hypothetical protein NDU88_005393 [Pleurodeles waltl]|uniref:Uncharacterized protein n=1 Tax=Pleurodeles waltl TaxID=8319 RepID=A0AAV7LPF8_PLEWA|nr:hypothetical protein NDU88_005393 [Pleurodeles waltl]
MRRGPEAHFEGSGPGVKRVSELNWRPTECRGKKKDGGRDLNGVPGGRKATKAIPCSFPAHPSGRQEVQGEGNGPPAQGPEHGRRRGAKRNTARIVNSPSPVEMQTERRKAMEAAASLSGSDRGSQVQSAADCEPSDSDHESETSKVSDRSGPTITPGTSDCII